METNDDKAKEGKDNMFNNNDWGIKLRKRVAQLYQNFQHYECTNGFPYHQSLNYCYGTFLLEEALNWVCLHLTEELLANVDIQSIVAELYSGTTVSALSMVIDRKHNSNDELLWGDKN